MEKPHPLVSVVVSVRGNAGSLPGLLTALAGQGLGPDEMEAVIVDNDPPGPLRPATQTVAAAERLFPVRVLAEPRPGLSAGRNRGICAARGDFVAVTDPDIVPSAGWLRTLLAAAREESAFAVGGQTTVTYSGGRRSLSRGGDRAGLSESAIWYWEVGTRQGIYDIRQLLQLIDALQAPPGAAPGDPRPAPRPQRPASRPDGPSGRRRRPWLTSRQRRFAGPRALSCEEARLP